MSLKKTGKSRAACPVWFLTGLLHPSGVIPTLVHKFMPNPCYSRQLWSIKASIEVDCINVNKMEETNVFNHHSPSGSN
jgi:hypothetical protein